MGEKKGLKREISVTMAMTLAIGSIIGAGIFSFTGIGVAYCGTAVPIAFILAGVFTIYMTLPSMMLGSAIPANGGSYMYVSRFVHPVFGYVQIVNSLIGALNIAVMGISFAMYFKSLAPSLDSRLVGVGVILLFAVAATFGGKISGKAQNIMVVIMILAIFSFIIPGFSHINPAYVTPSKMFMPLGGLAGIWAAVAVLRYSTQGGTIIMALGDEVKNPGFTIPFAFFVGTGIVTIIYALVGYVAIGVVPLSQIANKSLAVSAQVFLKGGSIKFFLIGGALLAITTTLNGSFLVYSRIHHAAAKDGIWPKIFATTNKYGVPVATLWTCTIFALVPVILKLQLADVFKLVAVPGMLLGVIYYLPALLFPKRLPNCYKKAWFKMPIWLNYIVGISSIIISFFFGITILKTMKIQHWVAMLIFFAVAFIYWFIRVAYLKKKNIDLVANMKGFHPNWIAKENEFEESNTTVPM